MKFTRVFPISILILASLDARAQSRFTNLVSFSGNTGSFPGSSPCASLTLGGNTLYSTTLGGGANNGGTVFKVNIDGSDFADLNNFPRSIYGQDSPLANVLVYGDALYGSSANGGTLFDVTTNGTGFNNLYAVGSPRGNLILVGATMYGTDYNDGTIFSYNINTTTYSNLYVFTASSGNVQPAGTNSDGVNPYGGLVVSGTTIYGTASAGGLGGAGTIYKVSTVGSNFSTLHSFTAESNNPANQVATNTDGATPYAGLVLAGTTLYGTTYGGGSNGNGTIFSIDTSGNNFTVLHTFSALVSTNAPVYESLANADGANPFGGLVLSGSTLYGEALNGGAFGNGLVFQMNTDGSGFGALYDFSGTVASSYGFTNLDGANPRGGLLLSANTLYGTAVNGGHFGDGAVFALSLLPDQVALNVQQFGPSVVLSWNNPSFFLQAATNAEGPFVSLSSAPSPYTNAFSGSQQFFRLLAN